MYREKRRNKIIIFILVGIMCIMGAGYAAFNTQLNITGVGNISGEWSVKITNVEVAEEYNGGTNKNFSFQDTTAELEADLYNKGDYVTYNVTVANEGDFDAKLETLGLEQSSNEAVLITTSGLVKGETLLKGQSKTLTVKIEYNANYSGDATGTSGIADITLDFVQNSGGTIIPTDDYLVTYDYTTNGGTSTNAENAYLASGEAVNLNYTAAKENAEFLGWNTNPQAGEGLIGLSMPSNDITLYAIFKDIDTTPPTITNISTTSTINSITVVTTATEDNGEIDTYEYSINNGNDWIKISGTNSYTFTGLKSNTEYSIMVRVRNKGNTYVDQTVTVSTKQLNKPTFVESTTDNGKTITIVYPEGEGLTYEYQKDGGEWTTATQIQEVEFTANGTLVARVSAGTNTESASLTVKMPLTGAAATIQSLLSTDTDELYEDDKGNIRYYGANPNNYVTFNKEQWRIIGVIDGKVKIIRNESIGNETWGSSSINNWNNSSLKTFLNGTYYNNIESVSRNMISQETYYLGGPTYSNYQTLTASGYYDVERSNSVYNGNPISVEQYIGLMYPSDYGYAAGSSCLSTYLYNYNDGCMNSDYLHKEVYQWLQSPFPGYSQSATYLRSSGSVSHTIIYDTSSPVFPVLYLKSQTEISGGEGSQSSPYVLS